MSKRVVVKADMSAFNEAMQQAERERAEHIKNWVDPEEDSEVKPL